MTRVSRFESSRSANFSPPEQQESGQANKISKVRFSSEVNNGQRRDVIVLQEVVPLKCYLSQCNENAAVFEKNLFRVIRIEDIARYIPLCDDFGPISMSNVFAFVKRMDYERFRQPPQKLVILVEPGIRL
jgi:hypothetical protein